MAGVTEEKIKRLISAHHELSALLILHGIHSSPKWLPRYQIHHHIACASKACLLVLVHCCSLFLKKTGLSWTHT